MWSRARSGLWLRKSKVYRVECVGVVTAPGSATTFAIPVPLGQPPHDGASIWIAVVNQGTTGRTVSSHDLDGYVGLKVTQEVASTTLGTTLLVYPTNADFHRPIFSNQAILNLTFSGAVSLGVVVGVFRVISRPSVFLPFLGTYTAAGGGVTSLNVPAAAFNSNGWEAQSFAILAATHANSNPTTITKTGHGNMGWRTVFDGLLPGSTGIITLALLPPGGATGGPNTTLSWTGSVAARVHIWPAGYTT